MAQFEVKGLAEISRLLVERDAATEKAVPAMLEAGAAVLVEAEKSEIERMKLVDTGDMRNSVKATKVKQSRGGKYIDVYPQGKDRKGVSNAQKGFIAQYGTSRRAARPWLTSAKAKSEGKVNEAMQKVWKEKQQ